MAGKFDDGEFKRFVEEQFEKETTWMEQAVFSEDETELPEITDEEVRASYEQFVTRLKQKGIYKAEKSVSFPTHRLARVAGFVVVCVLGVFAASMTSEANRKYFINSMRYLVGDDTRVLVDNDKSNENPSGDEYKARAAIEEQLGIIVPEFYYRPEEFEFYASEINEAGKIALMEYLYMDQVIVLYMDDHMVQGNSGSMSVHGERLEEIPLESEGVEISVMEVKDTADEQPSYTAQWRRDDVFYQVSGKMKKEDFFKFIKNIKYNA